MSKTQTLYVVPKYNLGDIHKVSKKQTKHTHWKSNEYNFTNTSKYSDIKQHSPYRRYIPQYWSVTPGVSLSPSPTFPSLSLVPPSLSEESKILISPGARKLAPQASTCGSVPSPAFGTSLYIKCSAPSSSSSDDSFSDSDPSSSMCSSTWCSV